LDAADRHKSVIRERREREKTQRIQSIFEAAKKVFFSKGYLRATMDEIALEAQISKPTIYQYFKTKDDLYFCLMLPVIEEIGNQMGEIEEKLIEGKFKTGSRLIRDFFGAFYKSYEIAPDTFKIVQLFQQTGLVGELSPEVRSVLNTKGKYNFEISRRIMQKGMERGLLKKVNVFELADVIWGLFVGIIQLEGIKSQQKDGKDYLKPTLKLAERIMVDAMSADK